MSELTSTGHYKARGLKGLASDTWNMFKPSEESTKLGRTMSTGSPISAKDAIAGGLWSALDAFPGGALAGMTAKTFGKQLGKRLSKLRKSFNPVKDDLAMWPGIHGNRELADVGKILPNKVLHNMRKLDVKAKIRNEFGDPNLVTKARNVRYVGMKDSDIILTPAASKKNAFHEGDHSYLNSIRKDYTPQGMRADLIETFSEGVTKKTFKAYERKLNEKHAEAMAASVTNRMEKIVKKHGRKAIKEGKFRITEKSWSALSDAHSKKILKGYEKADPKHYKKIKDRLIRTRANDLKVDKLVKKRKFDEAAKSEDDFFIREQIKGTVRKLDSTSKRFPSAVKSHAEATALGKKYPLKELNRVMLKERKASQNLVEKAGGKSDDEWMSLMNRSQEHALRSQGARESIEASYVTSKKGIYGETPFKPAEVNTWLHGKLK